MFVAPADATVPNATDEADPVGPVGPDVVTAVPTGVVGA
jgi:hypothetical protein